jgi:hypothetical protein
VCFACGVLDMAGCRCSSVRLSDVRYDFTVDEVDLWTRVDLKRTFKLLYIYTSITGV